MSKDTAAIRDQLGNDPDVFPTLIPDFNEEVVLEESPLKIDTNSLGHSTIVGSSTNSIVGTHLGTQDGQQQVVGDGDRILTTYIVTNNNNTAIEEFEFNEFIDVTNTTATLNTTDGKVEF